MLPYVVNMIFCVLQKAVHLLNHRQNNLKNLTAGAKHTAHVFADEELAKRKAEMPIKKKEVSGYLKRYAAQVSSADKGAIINR